MKFQFYSSSFNNEENPFRRTLRRPTTKKFESLLFCYSKLKNKYKLSKNEGKTEKSVEVKTNYKNYENQNKTTNENLNLRKTFNIKSKNIFFKYQNDNNLIKKKYDNLSKKLKLINLEKLSYNKLYKNYGYPYLKTAKKKENIYNFFHLNKENKILLFDIYLINNFINQKLCHKITLLHELNYNSDENEYLTNIYNKAEYRIIFRYLMTKIYSKDIVFLGSHKMKFSPIKKMENEKNYFLITHEKIKEENEINEIFKNRTIIFGKPNNITNFYIIKYNLKNLHNITPNFMCQTQEIKNYIKYFLLKRINRKITLSLIYDFYIPNEDKYKKLNESKFNALEIPKIHEDYFKNSIIKDISENEIIINKPLEIFNGLNIIQIKEKKPLNETIRNKYDTEINEIENLIQIITSMEFKLNNHSNQKRPKSNNYRVNYKNSKLKKSKNFSLDYNNFENKKNEYYIESKNNNKININSFSLSPVNQINNKYEFQYNLNSDNIKIKNYYMNFNSLNIIHDDEEVSNTKRIIKQRKNKYNFKNTINFILGKKISNQKNKEKKILLTDNLRDYIFQEEFEREKKEIIKKSKRRVCNLFKNYNENKKNMFIFEKAGKEEWILRNDKGK